jgi:hypothetical protein
LEEIASSKAIVYDATIKPSNDWTACRNAFCFVYTYASATIPTKQRPYAFWGLPALAFALHGWQGMSRTHELFRVFPLKQDKSRIQVHLETQKETTKNIELEHIKEKADSLEDDRNHWRKQAESVTLLLETDRKKPFWASQPKQAAKT